MEQKEFKICLIGGPKTGKTTFLNEMVNGQLNNQYNPTQGATVKEVIITTNHGDYKLYFWDTGGYNRGLGELYYMNSNAALSFYSQFEKGSLDEFVKEYQRVVGKIP